MRILRLALVSLLFVASVVAGRAGGGDDWLVVQATGPMWVQRAGDVQRISLSDGAAVAPGATLSTGPAARVLLKRGKEAMILGPNTTMKLPANSDRFYTTVIQMTGAIEFEVEKRNVTHFAVKTPHLAAVVKGTRFVVRAGETEDSVAVSRGRVEVEDLFTGRKVDLLPGQQARVSRDGLSVSKTTQRAAANGDTTVATADGQSGISLGLGGDNGVSVGLGGNGVSASVGGSGGVGVSAGTGGVGASVGGAGGVGVSVGGGGIGIGIGGIGIGIGGR